MARSLATAPASRRVARRPAGRNRVGLPTLARPLNATAGLVLTALTLVRRRRRLRIAMLAALVALPLLGGGWMWFRNSSFVAVERVQISGVQGVDAPAVEAALTSAARRMSTLDVSAGALRAAVAPLRVVAAVRAIPSFPHALRIEVTEQLPVAVLDVDGVRTALAADGVVLGPAFVSGSLPSVGGAPAPAPGGHVSGAQLRAALTVLGAAPMQLLALVERAFTAGKGLTVAMRNGLLVYFGDASRPHAKWLSLARVLADPSSAGTSYVDVRVPGRPAAGFPPGVNPPDASATSAGGSSEQAGANSESTIASLAQSLASGSGVASGSSPPTGAGSNSSSSAGSASAAGSEAGSSQASAPSAGAGSETGSSQGSTAQAGAGGVVSGTPATTPEG